MHCTETAASQLRSNFQFSEWNALGAWLWMHHRERIEWINTDVEIGIPFVHQSYSWGGLSPEIMANMEAALH